MTPLAWLLHPWTCDSDHPATDGGWLCCRAARDLEVHGVTAPAKDHWRPMAGPVDRPGDLRPLGCLLMILCGLGTLLIIGLGLGQLGLTGLPS
jgi:hypothetical protein